MSIQPLDLQVLFSRLAQLGKEEAASRDVTASQQVLQGAEMAKKTDQQDRSVNQPQSVEQEGVQQPKEDERKGRRRRDRKKKEETPEDEKKEIVSDPALGRRIDLSG